VFNNSFENDVHHVVKQDKKAKRQNVRTAIYWDNISQSTTRHYRCGSYLEKHSFLKAAIAASYFSRSLQCWILSNMKRKDGMRANSKMRIGN
jgi:hypothetical protein